MKLFAFAAIALLMLSFGCTRMAKTFEDASFCEGNDEDTLKDLCFYDVAKQNNDSAVCGDISNSTLRDMCKNETKG